MIHLLTESNKKDINPSNLPKFCPIKDFPKQKSVNEELICQAENSDLLKIKPKGRLEIDYKNDIFALKNGASLLQVIQVILVPKNNDFFVFKMMSHNISIS